MGKSCPVTWGVQSLPLLQTEVKGRRKVLLKGKVVGRSGPGCGTLLFACPGFGKCWEPEELTGRAGGEAE